MTRLKRLILEIHRRSLWQVLGIYVVGAWIVLQVADTVTAALGLPDWVPQVALVLLIVLLPVVLATAFVQEGVGRGAARPEAGGTDASQVAVEGARGDVGLRQRLLTWRRMLVGGIVAFSLLFGLAGLYVIVQERLRSPITESGSVAAAAPAVAVLPFNITGADLEALREGMVTLLSMNLDGAGGLRAIDSRTVLARWDELVGTGELGDRETSLQVAASTGARYALLGSAVALGPRVRIAGVIHDLDQGEPLGQVQVQGSPDSVLALVDRLTAAALGVIFREAEGGELPTVNLAAITTTSIPALKGYLTGEVYFRRGDFQRAREAYERAVAEDSTFALAHKRLAECYGWLENLGSPRAIDYTERAEQFSQKLPEREALLLQATVALERQELIALELVREATRTYPDDAEAWFLLGETYYHLGERLLIGLGESEAPFQRAVDLEPGFAPYRLHLIHLAFSYHGDSLRAARLIEEYSAVAPGTPDDRINQLAYRLAFGGGSDVAIGAALDTVEDIGSLVSLWDFLAHPRFSEVKERFLYRYRLGDAAYEPRRPWVLFENSAFTRGQLRRGLEQLDDPVARPDLRNRSLYTAYTTGMPVPAERLDTLLAVSEEDSSATWVTLYSGAYAADRGRWDDYAYLLGLLTDAAEAARAEGDSGDAVLWEVQSRKLDGYGLWKRGRPQAALETFAAVPRERATSELYRWWLGLLYLELDRPRDAARYFRTFRFLTPKAHADYYLGLAHERLGEQDKALLAYAYFVEAWEDADPELQPWVEDARRALERLAPDR
jgi:tetratricopeptide (TPR) repeat protein